MVDGNIASFRRLLGGYRKAATRFQGARIQTESDDAFHAVFEALHWAVALDDQVQAHWAPRGLPLGWAWRHQVAGGDVVNAVRCARNRVHHQWADALVRTDGFSAPLTTPLVAHEWRWRRLVDLPQPARRGGKRQQQLQEEAEFDYERLLAGQPARLTLSELEKTYRRLAELMEPRIGHPTHLDGD